MADTLVYSKVVSELRANFRAGILRDYKSRCGALRQLCKLVVDNEEAIIQAIHKDMKKPRYEVQLVEILAVKSEIEEVMRLLQNFMQPEKIYSDMKNKLNTLQIRRDPLGVVLIISPWNYPMMLSLQPIAGAIAAGNCVLLKPSEISEHTSNLLKDLLPKYLSEKMVKVVCGGIPETSALLDERFDHIMYTGGTNVGRIVMKAASKYLTPVTLELGGKSPAIVDETCNFDVAAKRIAWSRFLNVGQTCVSTDYVLCTTQAVHDKFITAIKAAVESFYDGRPKESNSYGRIINRRHFDRIRSLVDVSKCVVGGEFDPDDLYISPTVMANVTSDDMIMSEETFGPVLAVLALKGGIEEAIDFVNDREKPLALYVFSTDNNIVEKILRETSSGGVTVNDCITQAANPLMPFGGVGESGMGAYHGIHSLETFSHRKSCALTGNMDYMNAKVKYPPYPVIEENFMLKTMYNAPNKTLNAQAGGSWCTIL